MPRKKKIKKPTLQVREYWNYNDIIDWVEQKYSIKTRDFANKHGQGLTLEELNKIPYQDFWHWFMEEMCYGEMHNGSFQCMFFEPEDLEEPFPDWVQSIMDKIKAEFSPDSDEDLEVYVDW